jgi:hypothetical protein
MFVNFQFQLLHVGIEHMQGFIYLLIKQPPLGHIPPKNGMQDGKGFY